MHSQPCLQAIADESAVVMSAFMINMAIMESYPGIGILEDLDFVTHTLFHESSQPTATPYAHHDTTQDFGSR